MFYSETSAVALVLRIPPSFAFPESIFLVGYTPTLFQLYCEPKRITPSSAFGGSLHLPPSSSHVRIPNTTMCTDFNIARLP